MAGVTDKGWEAKTFDDIITSLVNRAKLAYGEDFQTTPDSGFGQLANIFSVDIKDVWDLGQQITDTQNRDTAEGLYLDYLADQVGLTRLQASGAIGDILFTGEAGTTVINNTACRDTEGRNVLTTEELRLNRANCYASTFSVSILEDNTEYTLFVEGVENTINSGTGATELSILNSLKETLDLNSSTIHEVDEGELTLTISYPSPNNVLTTTNSANLALSSVGSLVSSESALTGDIIIYADSITTLVTPNLGVFSVSNPFNFQAGRDLETDSELRLRMSQREQSTGTATKPSIEASLSEITGVTSAYVEVNDTLKDDPVTGVPAKSFETFVSGGDEEIIAQVLWNTKSLFGQTHGDIEKTIIDDNGDTQGVKFTRPSNKYAWLRIGYTINNEEFFPADGEDRMRKAVVDFGETMEQGEDFEPTKFYAPLYTISGIYVSSIEIAVTDTELESPVFQTDRIAIDKTTSLLFDEGRVQITT